MKKLKTKSKNILNLPPQAKLHRAYDKRRAVSCKIIKKSESNPGYCKYLVTIVEKDGTVHKEPAYGRDMQDAISRLIWKERTYKVERKINPTWIAIAICLLIAYPAVLASHFSQPLYLLSPLAVIILLFGAFFVWYRYIEKANE